jgi:hypothetical protein
MSPERVMECMADLDKLPWKEQQRVLAARQKIMRMHGKAFAQPGARLKFTKGEYVRQANGSLVKVSA